MSERSESLERPKRAKRQWLRLDPLTRMRVERFKAMKRGWWSFLLITGLVLLSLVAELFINSRALVVYYDGKLYLPTYGAMHPGRQFGFDYDYEVNYRELKASLAPGGAHAGKGWVLLPVVPYNPYEQQLKPGTYPPAAPSTAERHYLGTDIIGRDILARLVYGFRTVILFSLAYVAATFLVGTILGCYMGYRGGAFDIVFQRIIEIVDQIPFLYVAMIVVSIFKPEFGILLFVFILFGWTGRTWAMRTMTYRERERDYVLAARAMGASTLRIIGVHIIPNIIVVLVTSLPFAISGGISAVTALDYLGLGLRPPTPSWGELILEGVSNLRSAPWILSSVAVAIVLVLVSIAFVGEGLRDAFDPKKYTVYK